MVHTEFFKFLENKDRFIDKNQNLTDAQKEEVKAFFKKYPSYENEVDWNKANNLTYEDFKQIILKPRNSKSQIRKKVKQGLESLTEGKEYVVLAEGVFNDKPWTAYQPLTFIASRAIASSAVPPVRYVNTSKTNGPVATSAKWCIAYQKSMDYWNSHCIDSKEVFIMLCGESIPTGKVCIAISENKKSDADGSEYHFRLPNTDYVYTIWNFNDIDTGVDLKDIPNEVLACIPKAYDNYSKVLSLHDEDVKVFSKIKVDDMLKSNKAFVKVSSNPDVYDCHGPLDNITLGQLVIDGKLAISLRECFGSINASICGLTTLEGMPKIVHGYFECYDNPLTSLIGAPQKVDGNLEITHCAMNGGGLKSLEGFPKEVGGSIDLSNNGLTSLEGGYLPEDVHGDFIINHNCLKDLSGCPEKVRRDFFCQHSELESLKGGPQIVFGDYLVSSNNLKDVYGIAPIISGDIVIKYNPFEDSESIKDDIYDFVDLGGMVYITEKRAAIGDYDKFVKVNFS